MSLSVSSWDLAKRKIHETIAAHGMLAPPPALAALPLLLERVHAIVLRAGLDLAAPQLDQNPDVSIDLVWFSRRAQAAVGLTVLPEGDADGKLWLHVLVANQSSDSFDPEDSVIEQYLTKFVTVARS